MDVTTAIILIAVLLLILFDIYIIAEKGYKASISYIIATDAKLYPIIAFTCGLLMGHFFWPVIGVCQ